MKVRYVGKKFTAATQEIIDQATRICLEYGDMSLTLRQLYYQFVARDLLPNNDKSYNRLGSIINDARLAGAFDWDFIVDRTRNLRDRRQWDSPQHMVEDMAENYLTDLWGPQKRRLEVWIEKDAAIGVIESVCANNNVPYFSCRGYVSQSEMYNAGTRIGEYIRNGEQVRILHIGDHDPSGLHMTQDITDRLRLFVSTDWANEFMGLGAATRGAIRESMLIRMWEQDSTIEADEFPWEVRRIALTLDQVERYQPPPNYAKQSDSRYERYFEETGLTDSWELDALDPFVVEQLIQDEIDMFRDDEAFATAELEQETDRKVLKAVAENWNTIKEVHAPKKKGS